MSDEQTDHTIKERLSQIFANPETAQAIASTISSPRPAGWGRKSSAPYFKRCYALEIQEAINKQLQTGGDIVYRYDTYCEALNISERTLYARINQSLLFLCERMDAEGIYKRWYDSVDISQKPGLGVTISIAKIDESRQLKPEFVVPLKDLPVWRRDLEDWLESDNDRPYAQEQLALSAEQVVQIKEELASLIGIMAYITPSSIKIIRVKK